MTYANPDSLVSVGWLSAHLADPDIVVVDASYKMPGVTPTAPEDYAAAHIPGAVFFDIDAISDKTTTLPHMLPDPAGFAAKAGALGIGDAHRVIVYDGSGIIGSARAWWSLRAFGHENVSVLDGGLPAWIRAGMPVTAERPPTLPAVFTPRFQPQRVRSAAQVLANITTAAEQLVDARSPARFRGEVPEPWPGRRSGHIPGSLNLDHTCLIDSDTKRWRSAEELSNLFQDAGIDPSRPVVTSCGSGITACVLALGLHLIGAADVAVYDGSWAEWGLPGPLPVETPPGF